MFKIIEELKSANPKRREKVLLRTQAKNVAYFQRTNPELAAFIEKRGTGNFEIRINDAGLDIIDRQSRAPYHPPGELFSYMASLGSWHHSGWVDKLSIHHIWRGQTEHGQAIATFLQKLYDELPELRQRMATGIVKLPALADGRRYSGPVIFLGIFTGLHILSYLNKTVVRDVFLIEPDLDRFALSCYFVDYEAVQNSVRRLLLHVGPNAPQFPIDELTTRAPVTASTWVRLLPAYPAGQFDDVVNRVGLRWRSLMEIFVPYDREMRNLQYGMRNLHDKRPFPCNPPKLSPSSTIAVVASGPSLNNDLEWLKRNQDRLIIMATISCARVLKENGIRPDFHCTLDTEIDDALFESLQLDPEIPLTAYFKLHPELAERFKRVLLIPDAGKANPVIFLNLLRSTHPTSGNLTTAFAAWCRPAQLLFLGLDLGFKDAGQSHVKGGWHDEREGAGHLEETGGRDHIAVTGNFAGDEGEIKTISYYNNARFGVEDALLPLKDACRVRNLSDGARISGAEAMRSADMELPEYPEKAADLEAIFAGFSTDHEAIFKPYDLSGKDMIQNMADGVIEAVESEGAFNWPQWAVSLDTAWPRAAARCMSNQGDFRIEIFGRLIHDLLAEWYRAMLLTETPQETELLSRTGLGELRKLLESQPWPSELDEFLVPRVPPDEGQPEKTEEPALLQKNNNIRQED